MDFTKLILAALLGNYFAPYDPLEMNYTDAFKPPSIKHLLGADRFGKDQLSRMMMGSRTSMTVCFRAMGIATVLGIIIGLVYSIRFARIARGSVPSVKERDFIEGVRSVGAGDTSSMSRFILPNVLSPLIVQATFSLFHTIMMEAGLSFRGLGIQTPRPSWGLMLNEAREFRELTPWLAVFPGVEIIFAMLAFNF